MGISIDELEFFPVHEIKYEHWFQSIQPNGMYSGGYPFSVPVIPVHFLGVKTDYLLRS